jgi:hypothetical protein
MRKEALQLTRGGARALPLVSLLALGVFNWMAVATARAGGS